jgi:hypothetical protein
MSGRDFKMERRMFLKGMSVVAAGIPAGCGSMPAQDSNPDLDARKKDQAVQGAAVDELKPGQIQHMVIFNLKYDTNSSEILTFLKDGKRILSAIPVVKNFQVFSQVSKKNDYDFGFSMVFANRAAYEQYNNHPDHVRFVEQRWKTEVSRFLEIDFSATIR